MRTRFAFVRSTLPLIATALALTSCNGQGGVDWPRAAKCAAAPAADVLRRVVDVLERGADRPSLDELARQHGAEVVACVLDDLFRVGTRVGAASEQVELSQRARAALDLVGTEPSVEPEP